MSDSLPEYVVQGEQARLFPVLSTTSKEGRATSIFLACLAKVDEFGASLLRSVGQRVGSRSRLETYTEVVLKNRPAQSKDRPDGLIVLRSGQKEWRALIEAKVGSNELQADQIEKYRNIAKDNDIDCVITISNHFTAMAELHPLDDIRRSRSKIPVYHWSWMRILTDADLLINQESVSDLDQRIILNELRRFLSHESAGVKGFDRMPREWSELNKLVASGGVIPAKSDDAVIVVDAWHQETRDLSLILSRMTETSVSERLSRKHRANYQDRCKDAILMLCESKRLGVVLDIPDAAAPLEVIADIVRRCVDVGMSLRAPEDKVSTKARVNWLLRQIKNDNVDDLHLRLLWPGKNEPTQHTVIELREQPEKAGFGKEHIAPHSFHLFYSKSLGARFAQQGNFIADLEKIAPAFYREVGSRLVAWQKTAPKIKTDRAVAEDVSTVGLSEDAHDYEP